MLKVKSGDLDKLGLLYERYWKQLYGFFYHMCGDKYTSEDLVQNLFIKVLKYRRTYRSEGSFEAWIYRLSRNLYYDHYKTQSKKKAVEISSSEAVDLGEQADIGSNKRIHDDSMQLALALQQISVEKREILTLKIHRGMGFREISEVLGCTEGAARVRAHRALNDLRRIFLQLEKK